MVILKPLKNFHQMKCAMFQQEFEQEKMMAPPVTPSQEFLSKKVLSVLMMLSINALIGKSHFAAPNGVLATLSATQKVRTWILFPETHWG